MCLAQLRDRCDERCNSAIAISCCARLWGIAHDLLLKMRHHGDLASTAGTVFKADIDALLMMVKKVWLHDSDVVRQCAIARWKISLCAAVYL